MLLVVRFVVLDTNDILLLWRFRWPNRLYKQLQCVMPREGCACVAACCTVHRFQRKQLLRSCGILDGPANSVCCLARHYLCRRLQHSRANFDMFWLNYARALVCGTWLSKESVCSSFCWTSGYCRRATKAAKTLPCCAMNAHIRSCVSSGIVENICWVCCWYWY